jgi:putative transposase
MVEGHNRKSIRLRGYDYAQVGAYFVTVCTQGREYLFGDIVDGEMQLNDMGKIVEKFWEDIPVHFSAVHLNGFVVMPNHVHGILSIVDDVEENNVGANDVGDNVRTENTGTENFGAKDFSPPTGRIRTRR